MITPKQQTYWILDYDEFEGIIDDLIEYEADAGWYEGYSFISSQEANNYSSYTMGLILKTDFFKYDWNLRELNDWLTFFHNSGKVRDCNPHLLLCALVFAEILPEGNYLITVSW